MAGHTDSFLTTTFNVELHPDRVTFNFVNADGQVRPVSFPAGHLANFLIQIENAAGQLFEAAQQNLKGFDPRLFSGVHALSVRTIDVASSQDDKALLLMTTDRGMKLNLAMERPRAEGLVERLSALLQDQNSGSEKPN